MRKKRSIYGVSRWESRDGVLVAILGKKIYFSSSGFARGRAVFTDYATGCVRSILVSANGISTQIPEKYMVSGKKNEDRFERDHLKDKREYLAEQRLKMRIPGSKTVKSGRYDFTVKTAEGKIVPIELKNVNSDNSFKKHIIQKYVKPENLAQLISYMIELKAEQGTLVYSWNREEDDGSFSVVSEVFHHVEIENDGKIMINGQVTDWKVQEVIAHAVLAGRLVERHEVGDRPVGWDSKWGGPCGMCTYKDACEKYDSEPMSTDLFLEACKVLAAEADKKPR